MRIQLAAASLVSGNKPINPLMADRLIRFLLLEPMSNLLRTHSMLEPYRQMIAQPGNRLEKFTGTHAADITFLGRTNRFVNVFRAVAANLTADR